MMALTFEDFCQAPTPVLLAESLPGVVGVRMGGVKKDRGCRKEEGTVKVVVVAVLKEGGGVQSHPEGS